MYSLNFIEYTPSNITEDTLKEYNETPNATAKVTGEMQGSMEIEVSIKYIADDPADAIFEGQDLADKYNADIYSITRTEVIATEEVFNK